MQIVDGKKIASGILERLKRDVERLESKPHLAVVLVGDDPPSLAYVRKKQEAASLVGIQFSLYRFPQSISEPSLVLEIRNIQKQDLSGIIVQLPLPSNLDKKRILNELNPEIDVDFLSWESLGKLVVGENNLVPPTPGAILEIFRYYKVPLTGAHVVLVGAGDLIGKPLTNIFLHMPLTLTVCRKESKDLGQYTKQADILITGAGKAKLIRADMVKKGAVVIDAGVSFKGKKIFGDVDFGPVSKKASIISPTPGGVGPITVAKLLENVVAIAKAKQTINN